MPQVQLPLLDSKAMPSAKTIPNPGRPWIHLCGLEIKKSILHSSRFIGTAPNVAEASTMNLLSLQLSFTLHSQSPHRMGYQLPNFFNRIDHSIASFAVDHCYICDIAVWANLVLHQFKWNRSVFRPCQYCGANLVISCNGSNSSTSGSISKHKQLATAVNRVGSEEHFAYTSLELQKQWLTQLPEKVLLASTLPHIERLKKNIEDIHQVPRGSASLALKYHRRTYRERWGPRWMRASPSGSWCTCEM